MKHHEHIYLFGHIGFFFFPLGPNGKQLLMESTTIHGFIISSCYSLFVTLPESVPQRKRLIDATSGAGPPSDHRTAPTNTRSGGCALLDHGRGPKHWQEAAWKQFYKTPKVCLGCKTVADLSHSPLLTLTDSSSHRFGTHGRVRTQPKPERSLPRSSSERPRLSSGLLCGQRDPIHRYVHEGGAAECTIGFSAAAVHRC